MWGRGTARAGSAPPELELPERAETLPEVAEGGRLEGNRARGFSLYVVAGTWSLRAPALLPLISPPREFSPLSPSPPSRPNFYNKRLFQSRRQRETPGGPDLAAAQPPGRPGGRWGMGRVEPPPGPDARSPQRRVEGSLPRPGAPATLPKSMAG